jgi:hypothetical protein
LQAHFNIVPPWRGILPAGVKTIFGFRRAISLPTLRPHSRRHFWLRAWRGAGGGGWLGNSLRSFLMHFPYPDMQEAREAWPIVQQAIQGDPADIPTSTKAGYVITGFGLSLYPGEPGFSGEQCTCPTAPKGYGKDAMVEDLDAAFGLAGPADEVALKKLPWASIIAILMQLMSQWMKP